LLFSVCFLVLKTLIKLAGGSKIKVIICCVDSTIWEFNPDESAAKKGAGDVNCNLSIRITLKTKEMKTIISAFIICLLPLITKANINSRSYSVADTSLSDIIVLYYNLKDALVNSDASAASASATKLLDAVNKLNTNSLTAPDKKMFVSLQPKLAYDARHISEVKSIDHQREHFAELSANMYKLAKAMHLSGDPIYEDYCPMKKVYWLSKDEVIKNPYYGKQMLSCGKVADVIK